MTAAAPTDATAAGPGRWSTWPTMPSAAAIESPAAYRDGPAVPDGQFGLRLAGAGLSRRARRLLGPVVPGAELPGGARVPGTAWELDPVQAAFNIGAMIRWLDYNDTWLAAEWGHPSDNLGAILACADWVSRQRSAAGREPLRVRDVLTAMIKAYEIQGVICPGERLQPRGARSRAPGPRGQRGRGHGHASADRAAGAQCRLQRLDRRRLPADLPPCPQHGLAEVVGGRRRHQPRRAAGALGHAGRDGLSRGA